MSREHAAMALTTTTAAQTKNNRAGPNTEMVWADTKIVQGNTMFERIYVWFFGDKHSCFCDKRGYDKSQLSSKLIG